MYLKKSIRFFFFLATVFVGDYRDVLVSAGIDFFVVAGTGLFFGFNLRILLITH